MPLVLAMYSLMSFYWYSREAKAGELAFVVGPGGQQKSARSQIKKWEAFIRFHGGGILRGGRNDVWTAD